MAYLGTETIGGRPAWRVGEEGRSILTDDPLYALQHGAPVFGSPEQAQEMAPMPEPMPDERTAGYTPLFSGGGANKGAAEHNRGIREEFKNERSDMAGGLLEGSLANQGAGAGGMSEMPGPGMSELPPEPEAPQGETVTLQPGQPGAEPGMMDSPGSQFRQSYAEQVAGNMLPPGMRYVGGQAGREAMWLPGQRTMQVQGDPELTEESIQALERANIARKMADAEAYDARRINSIENEALAVSRQNEAFLERNKLEALAGKREREMERRWEQVDAALRDAADTKVDPKRFTNDMSFGEKVLVGALMAIGGAGAAAAGQQSAAAAALDKQIERDIAQQEDVLRSKRDKAKALETDFSRWYRENDPELARSMARAQMLEYQKAVLMKAAARQEYRMLRPQLLEAAAEREARQAQELQAIGAGIQTQTSERFIPEVQARRGGIVQRPLTAKEAKEALETGKMVGEELDSSGVGAVDDGKSVRDPTSGTVIKRHEDAKQINKDLYLYQAGRNDIDTLNSMAEQYSSMNPEERAKAEAQAAIVAQRIWSGAMGRSDAPSAEEMEPIKNIASNPTEFFRSSSRTRARLKTIRDSMDNTESVYRNSFGIPQGTYETQPYTQVR